VESDALQSGKWIPYSRKLSGFTFSAHWRRRPHVSALTTLTNSRNVTLHDYLYTMSKHRIRMIIFVTYLRAYSAVQKPIIKQARKKREKQNKHIHIHTDKRQEKVTCIIQQHFSQAIMRREEIIMHIIFILQPISLLIVKRIRI
jgi:hypothetical protein